MLNLNKHTKTKRQPTLIFKNYSHVRALYTNCRTQSQPRILEIIISAQIMPTGGDGGMLLAISSQQKSVSISL